MFFEVLSNSNECKARTGKIRTDHSEIPTPVFMPVGTLATVKAIEQRELYEMQAEIILANTYHLFLRPGMEVIENAGGLHKFMNWKKTLLTDSGGFQIFSLAKLKKVFEDGVEFASHLNGDKFFLSPEDVIDIQRTIGSDIIMPLDECLPNPSGKEVVSKSLKLTESWESRCFTRFRETEVKYGFSQRLFAICQGGIYPDLRKQNIEELMKIDFDGYAIGGLAVGETSDVMYNITDISTGFLPKDKPRYLMGVGTPVDLIECVERGIDMFDCVLPTRNARHGKIFTTYGELNIKSAKYKNDFNSIDDECLTYTSENFSSSYLRHLFVSNEMLGAQLASIHNVGFYLKLMNDMRNAIEENKFLNFKKSFLEKYYSKQNIEN
jgi:queuine tRNA-ribosyltransferase